MKCRKLANGNWECYAEGPRDPMTNKRNAIRRQAKKKSEAQKKVKAQLELLESGVDNANAGRVTFEEVAADWLRVYSLSGVKNSTIRARRAAIRKLLPFIGAVPIGRLTHAAMQNILVQLDADGHSRSLLDSVKVTANYVFAHAIKHRLRLDNPVADIVVPKKRLTVEEIERQDIPEKYFERDELERFLQASLRLGLPNDREWFFLLAFTGMRVGELCALKWTDINFEDKQIRITKTIDNPTHNMRTYELTPPKTKKAIRAIDVDDDILTLLKKHRAKQQRIRLKFKRDIPDYDDGNFVFARDSGHPYSGRFIYGRTIRLCRAAGLSKVEGPHILRHTHITMLTESGVDLPTIMQRVGHDDSRTTTSIYTHITKRMKKEAANQLSSRYGDLFHIEIR